MLIKRYWQTIATVPYLHCVTKPCFLTDSVIWHGFHFFIFLLSFSFHPQSMNLQVPEACVTKTYQPPSLFRANGTKMITILLVHVPVSVYATD